MSAGRVHLYFEDKTGGGLGVVLERAVNARRAEPIRFTSFHVSGNSELVKRITAFPKVIFSNPNPPDHVVYIIDARNAEDVHRLRLAPGGNLEVGQRVEAIQGAMLRVAEEECGERWARIKPRFHAHVLVWERESLILPIADLLDLGPPEPDVEGERHAHEWVKRRYREYRSGIGYAKGGEGRELLQKIVNQRELRERTIQANPSLERMVASLFVLAPVSI